MFLKHEFTKVDTLQDPKQLPAAFSRTPYDVCLLDMNFSRGLNDGREGGAERGATGGVGGDANVFRQAVEEALGTQQIQTATIVHELVTSKRKSRSREAKSNLQPIRPPRGAAQKTW